MEDGSSVLIIAEPPDAFTAADLSELLPHGAMFVSTPLHGIGFDGWTKDFLASLPPMSEDPKNDLLAEIYIKLFKTTYKARATRLPTPEQRDTLGKSLDMTANHDQLVEGWHEYFAG